jgi:predicted adenylyl cyclase CyaB
MRNLEIKSRYPDHRRADLVARNDLHADFFGTLTQTDTYFDVPCGRLKLRHNRHQPAEPDKPVTDSFELIAYRRPNSRSARSSNYDILPLAEGSRARDFLAAALGVKVVVHKTRRVYLRDNLRVHLDTVRGLGRFLEFELIVSPRHPAPASRSEMRRLTALFGIRTDDLVAGSYSDLLMARAHP